MAAELTEPTTTFWSRIYVFLFRFLGPADLGDPNEAPPPARPQAGPCPRCGRSMTDHTYVETPERRRLRCPA